MSSRSFSSPCSNHQHGPIDAVAFALALKQENVNVGSLQSEISKYSYADKGGRLPDTQPFTALWEQEVHRLGRLVQHYQNDLEFSAKTLLTQTEVLLEQVSGCNNKHSANSSTTTTKTTLDQLSQQVDGFVDGCNALQDFLNQNRAALGQVAVEADQRLRTACAASLQKNAAVLPRTLHSVLAVVASDIYAALRTARERLEKGDNKDDGAVWQAPSSFQRTTTKYWVKEDQLTKLLLTSVGLVPLLVYGKKGTLTPKENRHNTAVSAGDVLWKSLTTTITSVYFDGPGMALYQKRLARLEGAQLLRVRWYGTTRPTGTDLLFLELKTHHEKWVVNESVKERAAIQAADMATFLQPTPWTSPTQAEEVIRKASPHLTGEELNKATNLLFQMHALVVKHKLRACVRSVYVRAAFQSAQTNDLRLTLDRNVTMIDETKRSANSGWCLSDEEARHATRSVLVPFNVFEVKLVGDNPMPPAMAALIAEGVMEEASKFSKFLTGAAAFQRVPTLPYWANHPAFCSIYGLSKAGGKVSEDDNSTSPFDLCDCYHLFGSDEGGPDGGKKTTVGRMLKNAISEIFNPTFAGQPPVGATNSKSAVMIGEDRAKVKIAEKKPVRVEPKSFFANERTFIQWISASLLLLTVSTIMMGNGDYMRTAALISFAALNLVVYATFVYFKRIKLLQNAKGYGYIDHVGPTILAIGVGIGVMIVFWDIVGATDVLGQPEGHEGDRRRTIAYDPRRLMTSFLDMDQDIVIPSKVSERPGECFRQPLHGVNALTFQPNDLVVVKDQDHHNNAELLIASSSGILSHSMQLTDAVTQPLVHLDGAKLGGLTVVDDDRIFALSAGPRDVELFEFARTETGNLEQQRSWTVSNHAEAELNGLAFVKAPATANGDNAQDLLYMGVDGAIHSYRVPPRHSETASLTRVDTLNMKLLERGVDHHLTHHTTSDQHRKTSISAMQVFEGITFVLHTTARLLRAWDLESGEFLAELPLPKVDDDASHWKGFALERRTSLAPPQLRGATPAESSSPDVVMLHLSLDAPPQIWTFVLTQAIGVDGARRGHFVFRDCAGLSTSVANHS